MGKGCQKSHQAVGCRPAERTGADPALDTEPRMFSWQAAPLSAYVNPQAAEPQSPCCRGLPAQVRAPCVPHTPPLPRKPLWVFWGAPNPESSRVALTLPPKPTTLHQCHGCRRLRRICWDGKNNGVKIAAPASPLALPMAPTSPQPPGARWDGDSPLLLLVFWGDELSAWVNRG